VTDAAAASAPPSGTSRLRAFGVTCTLAAVTDGRAFETAVVVNATWVRRSGLERQCR